MIKYLFTAAVVLCCSCNEGDFINHKLSAEKAGSCSGAAGAINMVSNTAGERYTFSVCLPNGHNAKDYTVTRKGDTLLVAFPQAKAGEAMALYNITLDIDAKPHYRFIKLGEELVAVTSQRQSY
jgi:hypothetical protein